MREEMLTKGHCGARGVEKRQNKSFRRGENWPEVNP